MKKKFIAPITLSVALLLSALGIVSGSAQTNTTNAVQEAAIESVVWSSNVELNFEEDSFVFKSDGLPSHGVLDAYLGKGNNGFFVAEDIQSYDAEFSIPLNPVLADSPTETNMGVIGVAVSGAVFFDAFEGGADADVYAVEDNTIIDGVPFIDSCNGHGLPNGMTYHYHGIPYCITDVLDTAGEHSKAIGYLLDGFPIYGPQDVNGEVPTDLDACNSHFGPTPEYPEGIQHYHTTEAAPYIANCYVGEVSLSNSRGPGPQGSGQGGPPQQGGQGGPPGGQGGPDFSAAARALGVSQEVLMAAIGGPPPNFEAAAVTLGISIDELMAVMPAPPNRP